MRYDTFAIRSAMLSGVEPVPIVIEVSISQGLPGVTIVGLADAAVCESRERVRCAIRESGFEWPQAHFTVNLAPSEVRKTGTGFDLPIAAAILACTGQIPAQDLDACLFVGELGLQGAVNNVRGLVAYAILAEQQGLTLVGPSGIVPVGDCETHVIRDLRQLRGGVANLEPGCSMVCGACATTPESSGPDFADVVDQEMAKRAFVISAAGNHGLLMVGSPGAGKSMMAKCMPSILAPLSDEEKAEVLLIHSVAGQSLDAIWSGRRPFRAPHHAITFGGLVGGGRPVRPGEISLAHKGVLFLDELPEFGPSVLQALRQPMEDHVVHVVRVEGNYCFPCDFMLVAASNPCPCGYLGDPDHTCTCTPTRIQNYQSRIGGPLMDRIDVLVDVARPSSSRIIAGERGTSSAQMAMQVARAREFASWRHAQKDDQGPDRARSIPELGLDSKARAALEGTARRLGLGGRGILRIARVARTIADLDERMVVGRDDVVEACAYRTRATL